MRRVEQFWQDMRHGCRVFAKNPAFTAIAVISIAFGTGANVAIVSAADALLLRPLPVPQPSELMTVGTKVKVGATYRRVVGMVLRQGMTPAVIGLGAGLVLSAVTARLLPAVFPVRHQFDARLFVPVVPLLVGVNLLAASIPARRAARVDPTVARRCD